jgi:hypothetical protein
VTKIDDFAILAPVPLEHLKSGVNIVAKEGFVAYSSGKWELFREIDERRDGRRVPSLSTPRMRTSRKAHLARELVRLVFRTCGEP